MRSARGLASAAAALLLACGVTGHARERLDAVLLADGARGHWLAWCEAEAARAPAQLRITRLDRAGRPAPGWTAQGLRVSDAPDAQREPALANDGRGGVWVAWSDRRSGPRRVHVARLSADAHVLAADQRVSERGREDFRPALLPYPGGGVLVAWQSWDGRSSDVCVLRLESSGRVATSWPVAGLAVADSPFEECAPQWIEHSDAPTLTWTAYDGPDATLGHRRVATLAAHEPRVSRR